MSRILLSPILLLLVSSFPAIAQSQPAGHTDQVLGGTGGQFESIDLSNGGVNLTIPILRVKGRGADFFYNLNYSSKSLFLDMIQGGNVWTHKPAWSTTHPVGYNQWISSAVVDVCERTVEWQTEPILEEIWVYYNDSILLSEGSRKLFPTIEVVIPECDFPPEGATDAIAYASDLSSMLYNYGPVRADGSQPGKDTNGNYFSREILSTKVLRFTDTVGRSVLTEEHLNAWYDDHPTKLTLHDGRIISLTWSTIYITTSFANPSGAQNMNQKAATVLTRIDLPNGRAWVFEYANNSHGQLTKVILPTGGYVRYTYDVQSSFVTEIYGLSYPGPQDALVVTGRHVSPDGVTEHTETYSYSMTTDQNGFVIQRTATKTDAEGNVEVHTFNDLDTIGKPKYFETEAEYRQGASQVLRRIKKIWDCDDIPLEAEVSPPPLGSAGITFGAGNCRTIEERTTLVDGSTSITKKTAFEYDQGLSDNYPSSAYPMVQWSPYTTTFGNATKILEYDWGTGETAGPLVRQTETTYLTTNPANGNLDYTSPGIHIVNKSKLRVIKDAAGNVISQTEYEYDGGSLTSTSGVPNHDYSSYPASNRKRGNVTKVRAWLNTTGAWLETANGYNDLGNLLTTTDPAGHTTSFSYADDYSDGVNRNSQAYVTQTTYPTVNGVSHIERNRFYYSTALLYQQVDRNNQITTYTYDNMNRILTVDFTSGGQTSYSYNDPSSPYKITSTQKITSTTNVVSEVELDGLGRLRKTKLASDPQGAVYTRIAYDGLGRKLIEWNPTRCDPDVNPDSCAGENTFGKTEHRYDALGRTTKIIPPDGTSTSNNVTTTYAANTVTVTDQAGKKRKSETDALGRLIRVWEPSASGSFVYETVYQYDTLDNLTRVDQKGGTTDTAKWRTRTFTYNSLSQLLSATNPESGAITYTYDNDGNLLTKVSPAPNQTDPAVKVTSTFAYDALHRLTSKDYSNTTPSPDVRYFYDQTSYNGLTITNGKGRRTGMSDQAGAEAWSYDALGRVLADRRTTSGVTKTFTYAYNLDGSVASLTYPTGLSITYSYSTAARPTEALSGTYYYARSAFYAPHGALQSAQFGWTSGTGKYISLSNQFNKRLQPTSISVTDRASASLSNTIMVLTYDFGLGVSNNGNVNKITNNLNSARTQSFTYDELNRIKTAQSWATSSWEPWHCWGLSFEYDIWANLLSASVTKCSAPTLSVGVNTKNQINNSGFVYDAAGNLTADGSLSMSYDAENRMVSTNAGVSYSYDGEGKRVAKSNGKLYWYGMMADALLETNASGGTINEYVFFGGRRIARRNSSGTVFFYVQDHLGTSRAMLTVGSLTPCYEADYYPFGGERVITDNCPQDYKFTGHERDSETGLDYMKARYYSPALGRFLSVDPSRKSVELTNPQSLNRYAYTLGNPLAYVDPNGKWSTPVHERIIDSVFGFLPGHDRESLKRASLSVDRDQSTSGSFKHGMRAPFQEWLEAAALGEAFVTDRLNDAVESQLDWEGRSLPGNSPFALWYFGEALHTVTDRTSPWHGNYSLPWFNRWLPGASLGHAAGEYVLGPSRETSIAMAKHEARLLWHRYLKMLEEARKKRKEEERKREEEERRRKEKQKEAQ